MKIKRIKTLKVNCCKFKVIWNKDHGWGSFSYIDREIEIGTKGPSDDVIFMLICHELMEIAATELGVRLRRPDCDSDYIFVYDHRQHTTMMEMFAALVSEFIE